MQTVTINIGKYTDFEYVDLYERMTQGLKEKARHAVLRLDLRDTKYPHSQGYLTPGQCATVDVIDELVAVLSYMPDPGQVVDRPQLVTSPDNDGKVAVEFDEVLTGQQSIEMKPGTVMELNPYTARKWTLREIRRK